MVNPQQNMCEAKRCLLCRNARCSKACPISTDIPTIIKLYRENKKYEAKQLLFLNNPFSSVCSIVCDWYRQCAGYCIRGIKGEPIKFYEIEQELSIDYLLNEVSFKKQRSNNKKIAVIGGGPSGITVALLLAQKGYEITIYEAEAKLGGILRYGIPDFRLDRKLIDRYEDLLKQLGVVVKNNVLVGKDIVLSDLRNSYDAVYIASGANKAKALGIDGEDYDFVHYAVEFLKEPEKYYLGKKVIVIGGGNVAIDAARVAKKMGYDTTVYYRKTFENMPANKIEVDDALNEGVKFEVFKAPVKIVGDGMIFSDCENYQNEAGKVLTRIISQSEKFVECDSVIIAVSQTTHKNISETSDLKLNQWGLIETDDFDMTNLKGVFSSGDVVSGAQTVVLAVNNAKKAAMNIDKYLMGERYE